jgi:hypothetical protein
MELLTTENTTYKLSIEGYNKKTPIILKYIADGLLGLSVAISGLLAVSPDFPGKEWVMFGCNAFSVLFKYFTKFISEFPKF